MRLPSALSRAMTNHLGITYFNEVWNSPDDHGRANFHLLKAAERLQTGAIPVEGRSVVGLPTTGTVYAVYRVSVHAFGRFTNLPSHTWVTDKDVLRDDHVQINTYALTGRKIPEGAVYLRYDPLRSRVLVAIDRKYTSACIGEAYPNLNMTVYYDTTRSTPTKTQLYTVAATGSTITSVTQAIAAAAADYPAGTMVTVNGWSYSSGSVPTLQLKDVVEIVSDPDMVGYCELNIDSNNTGYFSDRFKEYREVLHIPKALNPNNVTITNDTITVVVYDSTTGRGVFGHQIDKHAVESITHNDFSMGRTALQMFQNALGASGIKIRLYVRYPTDPQQLPQEVNYLKDLYTLSDSEIKKQLVGMSSNQVREWRAEHLEKSGFLDLLYNFDHLGDPQLLARYCNAVGYYSVASTLAETMHYYTYKGAEVTISKPARLINYPCRVIVYADGRKIPEQYIGLTNQADSIKLGFKTGSYVGPNTRIGVYITEDNAENPIVYQPTVGSKTITVAHDDYQLFKVYTYVTPRTVIGGTANKGYKAIPLSPADYTVTLNSNGTATYKASATHYGSTFYLVPACGMATKSVLLDTKLANKEPIVVPLEMSNGVGGFIPLLGSESVELYINGYRLCEGIDYTYEPILGTADDILQQVLQISNHEYLDLVGSGNILEIVMHGDRVAAADKGYAISNKLHRQYPPMVWSASCGRAFVRGRLVEKVVETGATLTTQTNVVDGSPYLLEWTMPYGVRKLMTAINPTTDENLRTKISRVLKMTPPVYPPIVTISDQYALYSPYLARIVLDVANGALVIVDEVKDDAFLRQFKDYQLLFERDLILASFNPLLDRRFVTLAAHYANLSVNDPKQMVLVQRLITLTLLPAQLAIDEVLL